ncbi:MAG: histidinol dehydrogenase [Acidobacteria bacterium]|nr:histidinol dehydrogenase [Acidobacteriota bacterium]MBS1864822.1 histidinol dehydrogenase [Acidobacteriota bacterium]
MKIIKLTAASEKKLFKARKLRDAEAERIATEIVADVRKRGDKALFAWTEKLDGTDLKKDGVWIGEKEISAAGRTAGKELTKAVEHAVRNVRRVAKQQLPKAWSIETDDGVRISQRVEPIESIGCYIPGGSFALVSTLIMTAVPAQVAGVKDIAVVCPRPNAALLAAANILGVKKIARIGGAQAIGALAYGTKNVPRVEKIFGPGNQFVTAAKQIVSNDCAIDLPAGPTEAIVYANRGNARWIAADLLAQAEHAKDAGSFFVTTSGNLAREVKREVGWLLDELPASPARVSTLTSGAIVVAPNASAAFEFINRFAPEHLSLPENANELLPRVRAAGTVFAGPLGAQPLGDYMSGSNHVLPTGGWARRRGGLSTGDFVKCISVQTISARGFAKLADDVVTLAKAEGLHAHAKAIEVRR